MRTSFPAVAVLVGLGFAGSARAQAPDLSAVQIKATTLASNLHTLEGSGGTIGVLTGPDGVLMVDSQYAALTEKIVAAIRQISDGRLRFLVNTHVHPDHTGGNENLGKLGVTILSRDALRARLIKPNPGANGAPGIPAPDAALPLLTYDGPVTLHMNGEDVRLIPVVAAHTDGDTMVRFPTADVLMTGDFFRSLGYPNIDLASGGSLKGMLDGLNQVIAITTPATRIVPGHGEMVHQADIARHRDMILALRETVAPMVQRGMTLEQVVAAKPTAAFDAKISGVGTTGDRFVGQLYAEIKAGR